MWKEGEVWGVLCVCCGVCCLSLSPPTHSRTHTDDEIRQTDKGREIWRETEAHTAPDKGREIWRETEAHTALDKGREIWRETEAHTAPDKGREIWRETEAHTAPDKGREIWRETEAHTRQRWTETLTMRLDRQTKAETEIETET